MKLGPVVVNAVPDELRVDGSALDDAAAAAIDVEPPVATALDAAATFRFERHTLAVAQADRLAQRLPLPQLRLPFLFREIGPPQVATLADALAVEIDALPESP